MDVIVVQNRALLIAFILLSLYAYFSVIDYWKNKRRKKRKK